MFCKKYILRNFAKFTGKHQCRSLFLNKIAGNAVPQTFIKNQITISLFGKTALAMMMMMMMMMMILMKCSCAIVDHQKHYALISAGIIVKVPRHRRI